MALTKLTEIFKELKPHSPEQQTPSPLRYPPEPSRRVRDHGYYPSPLERKDIVLPNHPPPRMIVPNSPPTPIIIADQHMYPHHLKYHQIKYHQMYTQDQGSVGVMDYKSRRTTDIQHKTAS